MSKYISLWTKSRSFRGTTEHLIPLKDWAKQNHLSASGARYWIARRRVKAWKWGGQWYLDRRVKLPR
ncbi:hypothetical protein [Leptolyngbya sp. 7M]|uniref:hypothetical protein n=1 Tax=Leptolyngbya sp. 7M TaxID=2812896 RepID=UPI001B8AF201|nr:hypothetical protein [Leptolyngbya sp. 7M]QYO68199.1 hypothetical protein JVX88_16400 [Leptolyngbya sp. 7M]